jgi:SAM-dependent methyltransferase
MSAGKQLTEAAAAPDIAMRELHEFLINVFRDQRIRIYEAGGGSISKIPVSSLNRPIITVVDTDDMQLRNNTYAQNKVLGDVQTHAFPPNSFEFVVCYDVIEHLDSVELAIRQFHHALAPGGVLLIGAPNPKSFSGFVAKFTPHWFHVWFYRTILGYKNAGRPGQPPFRTVFDPMVNPTALIDFCDKLGFELIYFNNYISRNYARIIESSLILGWLLRATIGMLNALLFGRRDLRKGDYYAIFKKRAADRSVALR